ncbi:hypothetical protein L1887_29324 [Cichorium endivia]|nr:hypothetical protein L1887_29324 [Cichorium endivia]
MAQDCPNEGADIHLEGILKTDSNLEKNPQRQRRDLTPNPYRLCHLIHLWARPLYLSCKAVGPTPLILLLVNIITTLSLFTHTHAAATE